MSSLINWLNEFTAWLLEVFIFVPWRFFKDFLGQLVDALDAIPVPEWAQNINLLSNIPPEMAYFLGAFEIEAGMAIVFSALVIRFTIRRLPLIG